MPFKFVVARTGERGAPVLPVLNKAGEHVQAANGSGPLFKKVYNLLATSLEAVDRLASLYDDGVTAEHNGDIDVAADIFNAFLNQTSISFSILSSSSLFNKNLAGRHIEATLQTVKTENGSLLTIDPSTIVVLEAAKGGSGAALAETLMKGRRVTELVGNPSPDVTLHDTASVFNDANAVS